MKLNKEGLRAKLGVATWNLGNILGICVKTRGKTEKTCVKITGRGN
jgi:hypothetical protein